MVLTWFPITLSWNTACYIRGLIHGFGQEVPNELAPRLWSALSHFGPQVLCRFYLGCFGLGSFRPNLDSKFFFFSVNINLYHYGRVGQYELIRVVRGGFRQNRVYRDVVGGIGWVDIPKVWWCIYHG